MGKGDQDIQGMWVMAKPMNELFKVFFLLLNIKNCSSMCSVSSVSLILLADQI